MIRVDFAIILIAYIIGVAGFIPVAPHLPILTTGLVSVLLIVAFIIDWRGSRHIPRKVFTGIALLVIMSTVVMVLQSGEIVSYAVQALCVLLVVKFFEEKAFRDYMQIIAIALFLLAASSLFSLSLWFIIYIFVALFLITTQIVLLTFHLEDQKMTMGKPEFKRLVLTSLPMPVLAVPAAVIIFFILPRTDYPLFEKLNQQKRTISGFSENVELGSVSNIQDDDTVAFRAKMKKIFPDKLYWRGIMLDTYGEHSWKSSERSLGARGSHLNVSMNRLTVSDADIEQEIFFEPNGDNYLYTLNMPYQLQGRRHRIKTGNIFKVRRQIYKRIKYRVKSRYNSGLAEKQIDKKRYTQLPKIPIDIELLANDLKGGSSQETVNKTMDYFLDGSFTYATTGLTVSETPLNDFLFNTLSGNCEFFASSMAVLLRLNDIPVRLIGGFKGGHYNDTLGYYKVPSSNAHVWVEAWIDGVWQTFDPTPAAMELFTEESGSNFIQMMSLLSDSVTYYWNTLIVSYDFSKQIDIAKGIGTSFKHMVNGKLIALIVALGAIGYGVIFIFKRQFFVEFNREKRLITAFEKVLSAKGIDRYKGEGLEMLVRRITDKELYLVAAKFVTLFQSKYYSDKSFTSGELRIMNGLIQQMKDISPGL